MKKLLIAASTLCLLASCGNGSQPTEAKSTTAKSETDSLMNMVMHGHDEGMGKIGKLEKTTILLQHAIDSLTKVGGKNAEINALQATKKALSAADTSMNHWMDQFDFEMTSVDANKKVDYLKDNYKWVSGVADSIKNGLATADSLLKK